MHFRILSHVPSLSRTMSLFVRQRWPLVLLDALRASPCTLNNTDSKSTSKRVRDLIDEEAFGAGSRDAKTAHTLDSTIDDDSAFFEFRRDAWKAVDTAEFGRFLARREVQLDQGYEHARHWERNARRWFARECAPQPEQIRRVLRALDTNWLVGLGRSGYVQHALCLVHVLSDNGALDLAARTTRLIFGEESSGYYDLVAADSKRLDQALQAWRREGIIPTSASQPSGLTRSDLCMAYDAFGSALSSSTVARRAQQGKKLALSTRDRRACSAFELRYAAWRTRIATDALLWAEQLVPLERPTLSPIAHPKRAARQSRSSSTIRRKSTSRKPDPSKIAVER